MYGMGTSVERASATTELYRRGEVFGIPGVAVDGMNILEVKVAADKVVEHVRGGNGPYVMEMKTYRYRGHSMSDPAKYRTKEEVSSYRKERDPIDTLRTYMEQNGMGDEASFKEIDREIKDIVNQAAEFAQSSPEPDPSELWTDVLVEA
jgi:pyruvate dehydrogenase E1 component alpha subunit